MLVAGMIAAGMLAAVAGTIDASGKLMAPRMAGGSIAASAPQVLDSDITILNHTASNFTWLNPVSFNFVVDSNVSVVVFLYIISDIIDDYLDNVSIIIGLTNISVTLSTLPLITPGDHNVTIRFERGSNNATISHVIWVGTTPVVSLVMLFGVIGFLIAIFARVGAPSKPKTSAGPAGTPSNAGATDDDTSTVTYVDQSTAPAGRIFCPECKKTIEEGSIFCPECGTRIPRYLRYHP